LRRVKLTLLLAVILAIGLAPAVAIRLFPRETSVYFLEPLWNIAGSRTGFSKDVFAAVGIVSSFLLAIVAASGILLILTGELARSVRGSG